MPAPKVHRSFDVLSHEQLRPCAARALLALWSVGGELAMNLRKLAQHQPCYLRLYPFCRVEPGNVVLAHIRRGGTAGGAQKPEDINGVPACFFCHQVFDGVTKQSDYTLYQLDAEMLRAHCQWLDWLVKHEIVICTVAA